MSKRGASSPDSLSAHTNYKVIIAKERTYKENNIGKKGRFDEKMLGAPAESAVHTLDLLPPYFEEMEWAKPHLDSFNSFVKTDIQRIVRNNDMIVATKHPHIYLRFLNVKVGEPSMGGERLTPNICRLSDRTYAAPIYVDVEYTRGNAGDTSQHERLNIEIGKMPIMLRSCNCLLQGRDEAELTQFGECPLDPGGYFVIKGTEKVILIQEHMPNNRVITYIDRKGNITASVSSITQKISSKTFIVMEDEKFWVQLKQFATEIPLMVVMKAMGMESDQEVIQMVGRDPQYSFLLLPSIEKCRKCNVYTQEQALKYLDKLRGRAFSLLRDVFLANVPVDGDSFRLKCIHVAVMMRCLMDIILKKKNREYMGNKRFTLSGQLMSLLFEDLFDSMSSEIKNLTDKILGKPDRRPIDFDISTLLDRTRNIITLGLERALSTGNFELKRFSMARKGVTQVLSRLSFISALAQMTRVSPQFEKSKEGKEPRLVHPSQFGLLCPIDTPVGQSCGLIKHLALMTRVTTDEEKDPLISMCYSLGVEDLELLSAEELHTPDSSLVIFDGLILGKHRKPRHFATAIRKLRRNGKIGKFVSVHFNWKQHRVYLAADGGRLCRPLVIAKKGKSRIKQHHIEDFIDGVCTFDDFLRNGLLEYVDADEENDIMIALSEAEATSETTHIEIHASTMFGVAAGLIPYLHHNDTWSDTYQCAIGRQAMGNIAFNQNSRMDSLLNGLAYPQLPLVTTMTIELIGYDQLGAGQNAMVAVMKSESSENSITMNKASLDRGFGRCLVMKKHNAVIQKYGNNTSDRILRPNRASNTAGCMLKLDDDGMVAPGEIIETGDIYINKQSPIDTHTPRTVSAGNLPDSAYRSNAQSFKGHGGEVVDKVVLCSDENNNLCIKFLIRHTRTPEIGDRFSDRHGQKGVCGAILPQEDFPFSENGICPDLMFNTCLFPPRYLTHFTAGWLFELLGGKAGVSCGRFFSSNAFGEEIGHAAYTKALGEILVSKGFSYTGHELLYSGTLGCPLQHSYIFMGPIYYQKSKHMVLDKMHAHGKGPQIPLTRQPAKGRTRDGGIRLGERERDCLIGYGASMLIYERLMLSSDPLEVQVCTACGLLGYYNHKLKTGVCSFCKNRTNISTMKMPYACKLLIQELQSMNIVPRIKLEDA
ncbi:DNA-directed RNA polymerase III subunit 2-like [Vigna unguiculata]|uniref:DNA-directed RNA polymerase III subunit 2-like n=1 Tax=Vigna unguiculata TaxID=3917 RepID=UPI001015FB4E|nr:DNA-directed RNA polymerase III subunit 2-like [Vigna unguiculata]